MTVHSVVHKLVPRQKLQQYFAYRPTIFGWWPLKQLNMCACTHAFCPDACNGLFISYRSFARSLAYWLARAAHSLAHSANRVCTDVRARPFTESPTRPPNLSSNFNRTRSSKRYHALIDSVNFPLIQFPTSSTSLLTSPTYSLIRSLTRPRTGTHIPLRRLRQSSGPSLVGSRIQYAGWLPLVVP